MSREFHIGGASGIHPCLECIHPCIGGKGRVEALPIRADNVVPVLTNIILVVCLDAQAITIVVDVSVR